MSVLAELGAQARRTFGSDDHGPQALHGVDDIPGDRLPAVLTELARALESQAKAKSTTTACRNYLRGPGQPRDVIPPRYSEHGECRAASPCAPHRAAKSLPAWRRYW